MGTCMIHVVGINRLTVASCAVGASSVAGTSVRGRAGLMLVYIKRIIGGISCFCRYGGTIMVSPGVSRIGLHIRCEWITACDPRALARAPLEANVAGLLTA